MIETLFKLNKQLTDSLPLNPEFNNGIIEATRGSHDKLVALFKINPTPPDKIVLIKSRITSATPIEVLKICQEDKDTTLNYYDSSFTPL